MTGPQFRVINLVEEGIYLDKTLFAFTPILDESKMSGIVHIVEDFAEGAFWFRSHGIVAGLENSEELVDVLGSDRDVYMYADTVKCVRILDVG